MKEYIIDEEELATLLTEHFILQASHYNGNEFDEDAIMDFCEANGVDSISELVEMQLAYYYTEY